MSIYEVTNINTGSVEIITAKDEWDLRSYFTYVKVSALDPASYLQVAYYLKGRGHNENGPAIVYCNGRKEWWINGRRHNENGPAVVYSTGHKYWFINDKPLTEEQFNEYIRSHKS